MSTEVEAGEISNVMFVFSPAKLVPICPNCAGSGYVPIYSRYATDRAVVCSCRQLMSIEKEICEPTS